MRKITSHIDPFGAADLKIACDDTDPGAAARRITTPSRSAKQAWP